MVCSLAGWIEGGEDPQAKGAQEQKCRAWDSVSLTAMGMLPLDLCTVVTLMA